MNPRLRSILIAIGLLTIVIVGIILIPRGLSIYYQSRGGQHIDYVMRSVEGIQELVCDPLPESSQAAIEEVEDGIENLHRAVRFNRRNSQAYYHLGKAYCLLGEPEDAMKSYQQYTVLRPDNPLGHIGLGFAYEELGETDSSMNAWRESRLTTNNFLEVGNQFLELQQYDNALNWYQRAEKFDPGNGIPWYHIGVILEELDELEAAQSAYEQAINLSPSYVDSYYALGDIALNKNEDYENAIYYYLQAANIDSLPIRAYLGIGESGEKLNDDGQALDAYLHANTLTTQVNVDGYDDWWLRIWPKYTLGDYYLREGNLNLAKSTFQEAIDMDKNQYFSVWSLWGLGRAAAQNHEYESAKEHLSQALKLKSNFYLFSQINLAMGQALIGQGDYDQGLKFISIAHEEHPSNKGLHLFYAVMLTEAGRKEEAISEYKHYLEMWPGDSQAIKALDQLLNNY